MPEPRLEILGVHRPHINAQTWRKQWRVTADDERTHKHFKDLVLIEAIFDGHTTPFKMGELGQMDRDYPDDPKHMQVGYDEGLLSSDGKTLIQRRMNCVQGTGSLRFAVYLHFYDPDRPLKWQGGEVHCPPIQEVPSRLKKLMPYRACT